MEKSWLERHPGLVPRLHGNGFTQLYLNENQRLHVWHDSLPSIPNHNAKIHDHTWLLESQVLFGTVIHKPYEWSLSTMGDYDMHLIRQSVIRGREEGSYHEFVGRGNIHSAGEYRMSEGSYYKYPSGHLHESDHLGLTATLMTKTKSLTDHEFPVLVCPHGETPRNAFDPAHQPPVERMWQVINKAWLAMDEFHREELRKAVFRAQPMCCAIPR